MQDWQDADVSASELTPLIMRGMDCVNPAKFEQHVRATLAAYFAHEAAALREAARTPLRYRCDEHGLPDLAEPCNYPHGGDWTTELPRIIREAIDSGEPHTIVVPNEARKQLAESALARMGTAADIARITFKVQD
jgi:hypothetical protein